MKIFFLLLLISSNLSAATILFIGDSHSVGPFGWTFDQNLRDGGHQVASYASCGSYPRWWTNSQTTSCGFFSRNLNGTIVQIQQSPTPLMDDLLSEIKPDVVVMEFGGNYVTTPNDDFVVNDIKAFIAKIKATGAACFWITNPDTRNNRVHIPRILGLIKKGVGNDCPIFESHLVTRYPDTGGDGTHYWNGFGTSIAIAWANKAFEAFKTHWK